VIDPVAKRNNFFGEHVTRAARIKPKKSPGEVYVTESFAAQLALIDSHKYEVEYVGYMPMAKNYGDLRMYLLKESNA
jgi:adenylate cyclase